MNVEQVEEALTYLASEVSIGLGDDVLVTGMFLGWGDYGEFEIQMDDGSVHHCWPMLSITPLGAVGKVR